MSKESVVSAAAVQMNGRLTELDYNISQCADLAEKALKNGAKLVALPEFFTTPIVLDERLHGCSLPQADNQALRMLKSLASAYEATLGGSYLEDSDGDVFNTYVLVEPDGTVHRHRKDIPTMVENAFYIGGKDDGLTETSLGSVGMAVCWETIRSQTVHRLRDKVDVLMTGSHWWSEPGWGFARAFFNYQHRLNEDHMYRAPGRLSKLIGAPLLHAAHCGVLEGKFAVTRNFSVNTKTPLMGETQIVDHSGRILARRTKEEGEGIVSADIIIGRKKPSLPLPNTYWLEKLPLTVRMLWQHQNSITKHYYGVEER